MRDILTVSISPALKKRINSAAKKYKVSKSYIVKITRVPLPLRGIPLKGYKSVP